MTAPLCIIQARMGSTRLPGKMLLPLGGESLIERAWRIACEVFGPGNCVVAIPANDAQAPLVAELKRIGARVFAWDGPENDVLGRFYHCAHRFRWHPDSVIMRWTPDDPFKDPEMLRRVANGERLPVELGGEAFTLAMLDRAHERTIGQTTNGAYHCEHITYALFPTAPPSAPPTTSGLGIYTIDTIEDYEKAKAQLAKR